MSWLEILFYVLASIALVVALLLSGHGSSNGLNSINSSELELFKRTKDRGAIKWLQIFLFTLTFIIILIALVIRFVVIPSTATN